MEVLPDRHRLQEEQKHRPREVMSVCCSLARFCLFLPLPWVPTTGESEAPGPTRAADLDVIRHHPGCPEVASRALADRGEGRGKRRLSGGGPPLPGPQLAQEGQGSRVPVWWDLVLWGPAGCLGGTVLRDGDSNGASPSEAT